MNSGQAVPIFIQVAETIKSRIHKGQYRPGDLIPPAKVLEEEFNVSNITIRKALDLLARESYTVSRRGVGTQVIRGDEELLEIEITGDFREWAASASGKGGGVTVEVLEMGPADASPRVRELLGLGHDEDAYRIRRLRRTDGQAASYFINYGRPEVLGRLNADALRTSSFVELLQETAGVHLTRMEQRVRAVGADLDLSAVLEIPFGSPLFYVETIYLGDGAGKAAVTHMYYRGDRYVYRAGLDLA
jgi:GntR family transcriptional regulator